MSHNNLENFDFFPQILLEINANKEHFLSGFNISLFLGIIIGGVLTWLAMRARKESLQIHADLEKRELIKEMTELEKKAVELTEENQILNRLQNESITHTKTLENEIELLNSMKTNQETIYLEAQNKINVMMAEMEALAEQSEQLSSDTYIEGDLFGTPNQKKQPETLAKNNSTPLPANFESIKKTLLEKFQSFYNQENALRQSLEDKYLTHSSDIPEIITSNLMNLTPEDPFSFQAFLNNENLADDITLSYEENEKEDFTTAIPSTHITEVSLTPIPELSLSINYRLWRLLKDYNLFTLTKEVCSMLQEFAQTLASATTTEASDVAPVIILLPRERRVCKLVLQELLDHEAPLERYIFANMTGLSRFIHEVSLIKNNQSNRQIIEEMEQRLQSVSS